MENTYKLLNISLLESLFRRDFFIDFEKGEIHNNVDINTEVSFQEKFFIVTVTLYFRQILEEKTISEAKIKMSGIFECLNENDINKEKFAKINAPAIIFPYIREHLTNLSYKASIKPIFLPPVNFVKLYKEEQNN